MREAKSAGMLVFAAMLLAGLAVASPLSAQQSGRMQVHATVVDVSSSLDVMATLRRQASQAHPAVEGTRDLAGSRVSHAWFILPAHAATPASASFSQEPLTPARRGVTIFYY